MRTGSRVGRWMGIAFFLLSFSASAQTDAIRLRIDGNNYSDETIVRFVNGATDGFDSSYDAWKLFSPNTQVPSLYTQIDSVSPLSINALPQLDHKWTVGIFADISVAGTYTITPTEPGPFLPNVCIMLEDLSTGAYYDMRNGQSPAFTLAAGNNNGQPRFLLHFTVPVSFSVQGATCYGSMDGQAVLAKAGCHNWSYTLSDAAGNPVTSGLSVNENDTVTGLAAGTYTIVSSTPSGCTETASFTVSQPASMNPSFTCDTMKFLSQASIQFNGTVSNASSVSWDFGDGSPASAQASTAHTYTAAGSYTVAFTAFNGTCSETVSRVVTIMPDPVTTSISDNNESPLMIWSAGNTLMIEGNRSDMMLHVYNMLGQEVMQSTLESAGGKTSVQVNVPSGYYLVSLKNNGSQVFRKVFITAG